MNDAVGYTKVNRPQWRDAQALLSAHMGRMCWAPGDLVLDMGCGPGDVTAGVLLPALPADVGKVVGVDVSKEMVNHAAANQRHPKLSFAQMDIATKHLDKEKLREMTGNYNPNSLVEGVFDKVFSFNCLHWVPDQKSAFKNVFELMKTGGEALVTFVSNNNPLFEMYKALAENRKWNPYIKDTTNLMCPYHTSKEDLSAEVRAHLRHIGFEVITCTNNIRSLSFETVSHFKRFIEALTPLIERIPEDLRDAYLNDCISELSKMKSVTFLDRKNPNIDGHEVTVKYAYIIAHFKKGTSANGAVQNMG